MSYLARIKKHQPEPRPVAKPTTLSVVSAEDRERWERREQEIGAAMSDAIEFLGELCPPDMLERLDWHQQKRKRELDKMKLNSVAEIELWKESWRILLAELLIESCRPNRT